MISNTKFNEAKNHLFQDETITLLHETTKDRIEGILSEGLNLDKSYNGEISRVTNVAQNDDEIKNYNYYTDRELKTIVVLSIPKSIFEDVPISSFKGSLLLNCISQRHEPKMPEGSNWIQYKAPTYQRLASTIPSKWINGIFDEENNFIQNPNYILRQENSEELLKSSKQEILEELKKRYPAQYSQYFSENESYKCDEELGL